MTDLCTRIVASHNPTWPDVQQLLIQLFNPEERSQIMDQALKVAEWNAPAQAVDPAAWARDAIPSSDPKWNPNNPGHMKSLTQYQDFIQKAMKEAAKRPVNMAKV